MLNQISINEYSSTPKYWQIYNFIIEGIEHKDILPGDKLPSIHEVSAELNVAKRTVEKAYRLLKDQEIITATQGKGYYINYTQLGHNHKVLLLFNKLSAHKKIIYDSFVEHLGPEVPLDFFVYNNDFRLFKDIFLKHARGYTHYVIISHFFERGDQANELINSLPKHKLVVLDKFIDGLKGNYSAIYQNFEKDLITALAEALPLLRKYTTLNILFPNYSYHPKAILNGFYKFCYEHNFDYKVISDIRQAAIQPGNVYINLIEEDLVALIKKIKDTSYLVGQEVGILSYNETPLKELLLDGITVMSTDFAEMGRTAAQLVLGKTCQHIENPFHLIIRKSL
ncbi:GntR family transcriptional regulator [Tellurirhabdus bombi]|uniref:GntR family transcriptional regulator n=1 Tax=Tellurirhabdus bombi TaxID=2907205 RepID=UPI001F2CC6F9|nr:GntR family transcriptional regulator [Tellurirhabdus bombi]